MFHVSGRLDVIFYPNHLPCCSTLHRHYAERVAKHVCNLISRAHAGLSAEHRNLVSWHHGFISLMPYLVKKRVVNAIHLSAKIVFGIQRKTIQLAELSIPLINSANGYIFIYHLFLCHAPKSNMFQYLCHHNILDLVC